MKKTRYLRTLKDSNSRTQLLTGLRRLIDEVEETEILVVYTDGDGVCADKITLVENIRRPEVEQIIYF